MIVGNPTKGDELIELMSHYLSDPIIKVKVISYSPPPRIIIISAIIVLAHEKFYLTLHLLNDPGQKVAYYRL